ncbi:MAG TPA: phosphotransferase [Mycobacterium sp.]
MQTHTGDVVIERPSDLTEAWLTEVLDAGTVTAFGYERIGTGQMSECYRVTLSYADGSSGPESVVLKVAASDPMSRQTGLAMGLYEREVRFYTDIAPRLNGPVARVHHAAIDPGTGIFDVVLGDAAPAQVGNEIRGATIEQALLAVAELARLHAPVLGDATLADSTWLNREAALSQPLLAGLYAGFADRYADAMTPEQREVCERLVAGFDGLLAAEANDGRPMGLVHGDYRLDNMLFGEPGAERALTVVDWQTVTWGPALTDLSYFLGSALPTEQRRAHHDELLSAYHEALGPNPPLSIDDIREGVRRQSFFGVMMAIAAPMLVERTERGDAMFMTMLQRHCSQVLDLDALAMLPRGGVPEPLRPLDTDEAPHAGTDEALWNESWYFDFADPGQGVGGWVRLGLYPNEGRAWINALLCGPGIPTIALNDFEAQVPDDPAEVRTADITLIQQATEPLRSYRVTVAGSGQAYDDPSALLRGEDGRPVQVSMDLVWSSVGQPYSYRLATRYEIPCAVSGSVTVDGRTHAFDAVAGQRDHSWGVRDWWTMDWVWSALHLDDGTHVHAVDLRIPGAPHIGIGYLQRAGEALVELRTVEAREMFAPNGLPIGTELTLQAGGLVLNADVVAHAPVRLVSGDGRVAQFPRAWVSVTTADGCSGVGWVEWNRNL